MWTGPVDVDGELVKPGPPDARGGFFSGPGIYETVLAVHGQLPFIASHLRRMHDAALALGLPTPPDAAALAPRLHRLLVANHLQAEVARVNLRLCPQGFLARATAADPALPRHRTAGIGAVSVKLAHAAGPHKLLERAALARAARTARERGAIEAVLHDPDGQLLEGAASNLFLVVDGELRTPPLDSRILPGITRAAVIDLAREHAMAHRACACSRDDAAHADEVFVTSSLRLLLPVVSLDGRRVGTGTPGPVARTLLAALCARAGLTTSSLDLESGL